MGKIKNLENVRFGTWTATNTIVQKEGRALRICNCDCGTIGEVLTSNLTRGLSTGCDTCRIQKMKTMDGDSKNHSEFSGLYNTHSNMMSRCYCSTDKSYMYYGAKSVIVIKEWHQYKDFKTWALTSGWKKGLVLSRNEDLGNYEPSNVKWKTRSENSKEIKLDFSKIRKLSIEDVAEIRAADIKRGNKLPITKLIAEKFGISVGHVQAIRKRKSYKDVP